MGIGKKFDINDFAILPYDFLSYLLEEDDEDCDCEDCCCEEFDPFPVRILKSGDRTIVFWQDGTKTIVKRADDEDDNDYIAFTAALAKRLFGSNSAVKKAIEATLEFQEVKKKNKTGK